MDSLYKNHIDIFSMHTGNLLHNKIAWCFDCTLGLSIISNLNNCLNSVLRIEDIDVFVLQMYIENAGIDTKVEIYFLLIHSINNYHPNSLQTILIVRDLNEV